jgi:hypothetical protein
LYELGTNANVHNPSTVPSVEWIPNIFCELEAEAGVNVQNLTGLLSGRKVRVSEERKREEREITSLRIAKYCQTKPNWSLRRWQST